MSRLRECGEKKAFKYSKEANRYQLYLKRRYLITMHVYRCKYCGMYHMGHVRRKRGSRR